MPAAPKRGARLGPEPELLSRLRTAGAVQAIDVHIALRVAALAGDPSTAGTDEASAADTTPTPREATAVALALCTAALRAGSTCVDLAGPGDDDLAVAERSALRAALARSQAVTCPPPGSEQASDAMTPLVLTADGRVYLSKYWAFERTVERYARSHMGPAPLADPHTLQRHITDVFGPPAADGTVDHQRRAVATAGTVPFSIITGGPGTGKTFTVAAVVSLFRRCRPAEAARGIATAAPTGKAAQRLTESLRRAATQARFTDQDRALFAQLEGTTVHRLLGTIPGEPERFRHNRDNRLPYDLVVLDETSMVSLVHMARLVEALPPTTRLVLVGDADQLASVEAGAVMADLVDLGRALSGAADGNVVELTRNFRSEQDIVDLAAAIKGCPDDDGDTPDTDGPGGPARRPAAAEAIVDSLPRTASQQRQVTFIETTVQGAAEDQSLRGRVVEWARTAIAAAEAGDLTALDLLQSHRILCAHQVGPAGVAAWNQRIRQWIATDLDRPDLHRNAWFPGQPVMATVNDYSLGLFNGDTGLIVREPDGRLSAVFPTDHDPTTPHPNDVPAVRRLSPHRIEGLAEVFAMTVHKSQGSEFAHVTLILPEPESRILTRELLYTGLTRAKHHVTVIGPRESFVTGIRRRVRRATGLAPRPGAPTAAAPPLGPTPTP